MDFNFRFLDTTVGTALPTSVAVAQSVLPITNVAPPSCWLTVNPPVLALPPVQPSALPAAAAITTLQAELAALKQALVAALQAALPPPADPPAPVATKPGIPLRALQQQRQRIGLLTPLG